MQNPLSTKLKFKKKRMYQNWYISRFFVSLIPSKKNNTRKMVTAHKQLFLEVLLLKLKSKLKVWKLLLIPTIITIFITESPITTVCLSSKVDIQNTIMYKYYCTKEFEM